MHKEMKEHQIKVYVWGNIPQYKTSLASGADLCAYIDTPLTVSPQQIILVPTNTYIALPQGYEGQVRPRSGLSTKHGITLVNAVGTIDADYRGEIKVPIINVSNTPYTLQHGERIAQLVIAKCEKACFIQVSALDQLPTDEAATPRNSTGFGSTGKL